uniref:Zinc finger CCHC domain-containing protein 7 n=1 Tax=Gouania willdenowi TaxID=441366 RepID=A0A8C5IAY1_GOUWI
MDCAYQDWQDLEDDLYRDDDGDSEGSEANSELEFYLYSQLHYASNTRELEEQEDGDPEHEEVPKTMADTESNNNLPLSPIGDKLQQYLERARKEKTSKKKKMRISKPKDPKPSFFEEVIVIDSGPDVISISEGSENEEGICSLKGQCSYSRPTSTPAPKRTKAQLAYEVNLSSSTSEDSKSESDSDSADSDVLENWMILGRENQDGDKSISLNVEGGSNCSTDGDAEEEEGSWVVSDKDRKAQINNRARGLRQRGSNRYYTDKNVQCRNCNKNGHLSKNCLEPKKLSPCFLCGTPGHRVTDCPNKHCNNCGLPGHLFSSCSERAYWHKQCHRCSMTGHFFDTKPGPPIESQEADNGRSPAYCFNCSKKGHFGYVCTQKRMFNGVHPSVPFINVYDKLRDIKTRQHRIKLKVEDLTRNGYILPLSKTSDTPEHSKKKMKIHHHHKNNYRSGDIPHQTPKPSRNHIYFNDDNEFSAVKPKRNKYKEKETGRCAKPWKPKRPVPASRDQLTSAKHWNETKDFPRGGGTGESMVEKMRKKKKKNQFKHSLKTLPDKLKDQHSRTVKGKRNRYEEKFSETQRKERKKGRRAEKKLSGKKYPDDEDLFTIKQRKRSR